MSYGPNPWQQTQWDWRAAGNFICGGAGGGLIAFAALSGAQGMALTLLLLGGIALVGTGLLCVWLELGRPLRALHVFINPRTSWMTREAFVATLLMPATLAAAIWLPGFKWLAAALALGFVFCQSRMLQAAKGIPAWREPLLVPLLLLTGLAEGAGLGLLAMPEHAAAQPRVLAFASLLVLARAAAWLMYRRGLSGHAAPRALAALDGRGRWLQLAGFWLPIVAFVAVAGGWIGGAFAAVLAAAGGAAVVGTGAWFKFTLITRAGFNQGFTLAHLPVRGVRR
ncbi:MAG: dimethyl sulfoxide reductase anchor subunit [Burkholderiales bacterium]|nr:dimethyl sulfoxide reductase anchor subunit [Burkholderiales bacterium]